MTALAGVVPPTVALELSMTRALTVPVALMTPFGSLIEREQAVAGIADLPAPEMVLSTFSSVAAVSIADDLIET